MLLQLSILHRTKTNLQIPNVWITRTLSYIYRNQISGPCRNCGAASMGETKTKSLVLLNELIKVKLPTWKVLKADVPSVSLSSERMTKGQRSKRQLSKPFTVVIKPLSTRLIIVTNYGLIKPNFCFILRICCKLWPELNEWKESVTCGLGADISLPHCLETSIWNLAHKSDHRAEISENIVWYDALATCPEVLFSYHLVCACVVFQTLNFVPYAWVNLSE